MDNLQQTMESAVQAMARIVAIRDPYTSGHQQRVAQLAMAIGERLELADERINGLRLAAIIHDVGKVNVPSEILSKPGRLNNIEQQIVRTHPHFSYEILKTIDFPWPVAQIALQHHERINGSGYPAKLIGKSILLEARILSVADVFEAMVSHRPYRPALGFERAVAEITKNRGQLYETDIVGACLNIMDQNNFLLNQN